MSTFHPTTTTYSQGAKTLPRRYYTSEELFDSEQEKIFAASWNCVGRQSQLVKPGDYFLATIAGESLIIVKDSKGNINALFNVCRHRGTRMCELSSGHFLKNIQCSYHAWTYDTEGKLVAAPHMYEAKAFEKKNFSLFRAQVALWEGYIFVNINPKPKKFETDWKPMIGRLSRFNIGSFRSGTRYPMKWMQIGNWYSKITMNVCTAPLCILNYPRYCRTKAVQMI